MQLCDVLYVEKGRPGLVATRTIPPDQPIIEYRGRFVLKDHCNIKDSHDRISPFVLLYHDLEGANIVIDARKYGNLARFVRRSCQPNAKVRFLFLKKFLFFFLTFRTAKFGLKVAPGCYLKKNKYYKKSYFRSNM